MMATHRACLLITRSGQFSQYWEKTGPSPRCLRWELICIAGREIPEFPLTVGVVAGLSAA